ncbi:hypothetical protein [Geoalkalibacter halelectricus]|uniref:Uncharacterized protein n=1 Tax=Geoalkalibacter halelectricus TaxID=2847045 RepID=A0ABY5ZKK0_9BACT|nr:hypothetical protein [Geoalkalibacter halelectricus]MDO3380254.1 hypothetical protein [Geoalkalibacter halelectricus]UWZ79666.1 hypothetical protein L9S41_18590 [Geoalkalibacter halelectricus]
MVVKTEMCQAESLWEVVSAAPDDGRFIACALSSGSVDDRLSVVFLVETMGKERDIHVVLKKIRMTAGAVDESRDDRRWDPHQENPYPKFRKYHPQFQVFPDTQALPSPLSSTLGIKLNAFYTAFITRRYGKLSGIE